MAPQISSHNLDKVRKLKSGMTRLTARVQKVWFPVHSVSFSLLYLTLHCLVTSMYILQTLTSYDVLYVILSSQMPLPCISQIPIMSESCKLKMPYCSERLMGIAMLFLFPLSIISHALFQVLKQGI